MNDPLLVVRAFHESTRDSGRDYRAELKHARQLLAKCNGDPSWAIEVIREAKRYFGTKNLRYSLSAICKHFHLIHPQQVSPEPMVVVSEGPKSLKDILNEKRNNVVP